MAGSMIGVLFGVVVVSFAVISTFGSRECRLDSSPHPRGICGDAIPRTLKLVCSTDGYARHGKRSEVPLLTSDSEDLDSVADLPETNSLLTDYFLTKREATLFLDKRARVKITCECCMHKCSIRELTGYCRNPARAYARFQRYGDAFRRLIR